MRFISAKEAAELIGCSISLVKKMAKAKKLGKSHKLGERYWQIQHSAAERQRKVSEKKASESYSKGRGRPRGPAEMG